MHTLLRLLKSFFVRKFYFCTWKIAETDVSNRKTKTLYAGPDKEEALNVYKYTRYDWPQRAERGPGGGLTPWGKRVSCGVRGDHWRLGQVLHTLAKGSLCTVYLSQNSTDHHHPSGNINLIVHLIPTEVWHDQYQKLLSLTVVNVPLHGKPPDNNLHLSRRFSEVKSLR